jgi:glutamate synthase (ferredoxin)
MLAYHQERLYYLLNRHYSYTKSSVASEILKNFSNEMKKFKIVIPKDYKKALIDIKNQESLKLRMKG